MCNGKNNMTIGFLGTDLSWWGCEDRFQTERVAPAQHKSVEKEKVPGVGDWLPSDGKVSQVCLGIIRWSKCSVLPSLFLKVHACPFSGRTLPFIGSLKTAWLSFWVNEPVPQKGMVSPDGTCKYLAALACVICLSALMTLCAYSHVGYCQTNHFAVK